MAFIILTVYQAVDNIHLEGTMSRSFEIGPSFIFMSKKREVYYLIFMIIFLDFIKLELGPISEISRHFSFI